MEKQKWTTSIKTNEAATADIKTTPSKTYNNDKKQSSNKENNKNRKRATKEGGNSNEEHKRNPNNIYSFARNKHVSIKQ